MDKINNWQEAADMAIVDIDLEEGSVIFEVTAEQKEYMEQHTHEIEDWFSDTDYGEDYCVTDIEFSDGSAEGGWTCAIIFKEKISIIDFLLEHGIWDSGDKDCPSKNHFIEYDGCWFDWDEVDRNKVRECGGIYTDKVASDFGIDRVVTGNWIKNESESFFNGDYGWDYNAEAELIKADKNPDVLGTIFKRCI